MAAKEGRLYGLLAYARAVHALQFLAGKERYLEDAAYTVDGTYVVQSVQ